ncbi:DNA polymerase Y family protein [Desulfosporosinus nitroreducens]|uniref:DNA polymerase Y family protein n=1 Tax=Desulfosporosinus nitroreducens TaxID=2018668 RepID=UPI00207C7C1D|nr:DNA polymerase IV [Desulfosporosinus nitroreducens]MCO1604025.1 DNA polymerase IV [Desulfosporosinus nitroreducens]
MIFHIDVNSAYLSWEAVHRIQHGHTLDLRTVPSVVGGNPETRHGIVLTKSIPAKKYNIQTGETIYTAKAKCPELIIVPPNYGLYMQCSRAFGDILREYSPLVEQYSIDEYFIDFTNMGRIYADPVEAAYIIKERIKEELGFTVNIGISTNKILAKMASELKKPDKVHTIFPHEIADKMWCLPIEELFMVGRATAKKLRSRAINTIGDLAQADLKMFKLFLKSHGVLVWNYANGNDISPVRENRRTMIKGIGNSTTISFDVEDKTTAHLVLLSLTETVASRLRQAEYCACLVSVSIKTNEFYSCSHQRKLASAKDCTNAIHEIACELFDELWKGEPIRHLGVRVSELCRNYFMQLSLFERDYEKQRAVDRTVDSIRERFGPDAVFRSSFLNSGVRFRSGGTIDDEEYPMMSSVL